MAIPDFQSLMLPILKVSSEGSVRLSKATERLADEFKLTEEERRELLPSGRQTVFANRVSWAKAHLKKAELIKYPSRGSFCITDRGQDVLNANPPEINIKFLRKFGEYIKGKQSQKNDEISETNTIEEMKTPDERMILAQKEIEEVLTSELLEKILNASPQFFERLIIQLLIAMGYGGSWEEAGRALGKSGDNGVDGVINQDTLGLDRIYIQAKRYAQGNKIDPNAINSFSGSLNLHKANKGVFVTTSDFSKKARENAQKLQNNIVLINGTQLTELMIRYNIGCRIEETLHIKEIDEEFFE